MSYGSFLYAGVGAVIIALASIALTFRPLAHVSDSVLARAADGLRRVGFFPNSNLHGELQRLDLLRIVLAIFLAGRFWPDLVFALHAGNTSAATWIGVGLVLTIALAAGIATPLAALLLAWLLNLVIDYVSYNESLGSVVVANCLVPLIISPAGYTLSIDSILMRRPNAAAAVLSRLYGLWGPPTLDRVQVGRFLGFVAFASINVYSAVRHLQAPTWTSGAATAVILLSPIASPAWSPLSQWLYEHVTALYVAFSLASTYGMLVWQLLMLPLALVSRWTRGFVIVWGLMFFAFSTYVMHLKRLGAYEFVLWALVFWNGRMFAASWRRLVARWDRRPHPWRVPEPGYRGPLGAALALCLVLLLGAFALTCVPNQLPRLAHLARLVAGRAPAMFGIGVVDVFNERDLRVYRNHAIARKVEPNGAAAPIFYAPSESVDFALSGRLQYIVLEPLFCDQEFARAWFTGYTETLPPSHPDRHLDVFMEFTTWTRPTNEDLATFRYIPITWEPICVIRANLQQPSRLSTEYLPAAATRLARVGIGFEPTLRRVNLAGRFPCDLERAQAARWYDQPAHGTRTAEEMSALENMIDAAGRGSIQCLSAYRQLITQLAAADNVTPFAPPAARCESELAIAEAYYGDAFDADLQRETLPSLNAARDAATQGKVDACRPSVASIRRAYFEAIYGSE